jgi:hypothetical protein
VPDPRRSGVTHAKPAAWVAEIFLGLVALFGCCDEKLIWLFGLLKFLLVWLLCLVAVMRN